MYLEGCLPKPFIPRKPKPHGYPTNFVEPNTRPNSPTTAFFFYYSTCLGVSLAATLRKVLAIMNTFYQGVPSWTPFTKVCLQPFHPGPNVNHVLSARTVGHKWKAILQVKYHQPFQQGLQWILSTRIEAKPWHIEEQILWTRTGTNTRTMHLALMCH